MVAILAALATVTAQWLPNWNRGFARVQRAELARSASSASSPISPPPSSSGRTRVSSRRCSTAPSCRSPSCARRSAPIRPGLEIVRIAETADQRGLAMVRTSAPFVPVAPANDSGAAAFRRSGRAGARAVPRVVLLCGAGPGLEQTWRDADSCRPPCGCWCATRPPSRRSRYRPPRPSTSTSPAQCVHAPAIAGCTALGSHNAPDRPPPRHHCRRQPGPRWHDEATAPASASGRALPPIGSSWWRCCGFWRAGDAGVDLFDLCHQHRDRLAVNDDRLQTEALVTAGRSSLPAYQLHRRSVETRPSQGASASAWDAGHGRRRVPLRGGADRSQRRPQGAAGRPVRRARRAAGRGRRLRRPHRRAGAPAPAEGQNQEASAYRSAGAAMGRAAPLPACRRAVAGARAAARPGRAGAAVPDRL